MTLGKYIHTLQLLHRQTKLAFPFDPEISYSSCCSIKSFSLWDREGKKKKVTFWFKPTVLGCTCRHELHITWWIVSRLKNLGSFHLSDPPAPRDLR